MEKQLKDPMIDKARRKEIVDMARRDLESGVRIRELTKTERDIYGNAAMNATSKLPAFTSAIALLHPFVDASAETCYVDKHGRVGLSYFFLYAIDWITRATWLTHEAMHVMNSHFNRGEVIGAHGGEMNICGDLEINSTLSTTEWAVLDNLLLPEREGYPKFKTLEQYYNLREEEKLNSGAKDNLGGGDGQELSDAAADSGQAGQGEDSGQTGQSKSGNGSGSVSKNGDASGSAPGSGSSNFSDIVDKFLDRLGSDIDNQEKSSSGQAQDGSSDGGTTSCDKATESRESETDEAGIERNSDTAQEIARQEVRARIKLELESSRSRAGYGHGDNFYERMLALMTPPRVNWKDVLRSVVSASYANVVMGKRVYSYRRVNRRYSSGSVIFPGTVDIEPNVVIGVDTSGSMGENDFRRTLTEIKDITENAVRARDGIRMFSIDTKMSDVSVVRNVDDIKFSGGGGTQMAPAFKYARELPKRERPDIMILATDGYIDWDDVRVELTQCPFKSIILITSEGSFAPESIHPLATVINIAESKAQGV